MKCHILFSGKNKKNISKCRLLKILPRVLSVKLHWDVQGFCLRTKPQLFLHASVGQLTLLFSFFQRK